MVAVIHQKRLFDEWMPKIGRIIKAGGSAQEIFKQSLPFAAAQLAQLASSAENEGIRRQAAKDIIEQTLGKAVERSVSITSEISGKNEADLNREINMLLRQYGGENQKYLDRPPRQVKTKKRKLGPRVKHEILEASFEVMDNAPKAED